MGQTIQIRRDLAANWTSVNPILAAGEVGFETDTYPYKYKVGNGATAWNSLGYAQGITATESVALSNKTISLGSNTVSGTIAQFNTACTDADFAILAANTFTGIQTYPNSNIPQVDKGTVNSGTVTFTVSAAEYQRLQVGGALTIATNGWPVSGTFSGVMIELVNGGSAAITWPTVTWFKGDGTSGSTFSTTGVTLQTTGTNYILFWSRDGGTTVSGRAF